MFHIQHNQITSACWGFMLGISIQWTPLATNSIQDHFSSSSQLQRPWAMHSKRFWTSTKSFNCFSIFWVSWHLGMDGMGTDHGHLDFSWWGHGHRPSLLNDRLGLVCRVGQVLVISVTATSATRINKDQLGYWMNLPIRKRVLLHFGNFAFCFLWGGLDCTLAEFGEVGSLLNGDSCFL